MADSQRNPMQTSTPVTALIALLPCIADLIVDARSCKMAGYTEKVSAHFSGVSP
jgi:hypothetical protein